MNKLKHKHGVHMILKNLKTLLKIFTVSLVFALFFSACGNEKAVKAEAGKIVEAVENKDVKTLEMLILGTGDFAEDEALSDFFLESESDSNGVIAKIIEQDSIKVKKIEKEAIVYEITAPQLSEMFEAAMQEKDLSSENFEKYIYDYIAAADKIKIEVKVPYTYEDKVFEADYLTKDFINAITGNLVNAYQGLVQKMLEENSGESVK